MRLQFCCNKAVLSRTSLKNKENKLVRQKCDDDVSCNVTLLFPKSKPLFVYSYNRALNKIISMYRVKRLSQLESKPLFECNERALNIIDRFVR